MDGMRGWGRYEVIDEIGRGAMGVVYRARDPKIERIVALKTLAVPAGATPEEADELRRRFEREAKAAGRLAHPNIVHIYDSGEDYIAMELVEGATLDRLMAQGPLPPSTGLHILEQVALALDHAHDARVVHRDMKPSNILVARGGVVKIMDFGIAKVLGGESLLTGRLMGTPRYMSPEQVTGAHVTGASDNFALAEIAYEVLAGEKAFPGDTVTGILYRIVHEDPAPPSKVNRTLPRTVDPIFARAMAKTASNRYPRATDFIADLRNALSAQKRPPAVTTELPPRKPPMWRALVIPPAVILAAVVTLVALVPDARHVLLGDEAKTAVPPIPTRPSGTPRPAPAPTRTPTLEPVLEPTIEPEPSSMDLSQTDPTGAPTAPVPVEEPATPVAAVRPPATPTAAIATPALGATEAPVTLPPPLPPGPELLGLRFFPAPAPVVGGAQIRSVVPGSPTWNAGLRPKDIITRWQGAAIGSPGDLMAAARSTAAGGVVVDFLRDVGNSLQPGQATVSVVSPPQALQAPQPPLRPSAPSQRAVSLSDTSVDHDAEGGMMRVSFRLQASGYGGKTLTVKARLLEIAGERAVRVNDARGKLVEASTELYPESDGWTSEPVPIVLRYSQAAGDPGRLLRVSLVALDDSGKELATYASMPFSMSQATVIP
ncbi:MAG: protein kinase [Acidobacteriota bacterium]